MQNKLRKLAEQWKAGDFEERECASELLSILDAEGDDGAVGNADVMVCQIGDYAELDKRAWATVIYDDKKVAECYTNEDAELVGAALRAYSTHPARSCGVSDADVSDVAKMIADQVGNGMREKYEVLAKKILTHFAKGVEVGGDVEDAARYRWLREHTTDGFMGTGSGSLNCDEPASEWDSWIDAARKGERHE